MCPGHVVRHLRVISDLYSVTWFQWMTNVASISGQGSNAPAERRPGLGALPPFQTHRIFGEWNPVGFKLTGV